MISQRNKQQKKGNDMEFVAQFDVVWLQNAMPGIPVTKVFSPDTTLEEIYKWVRGNTGVGQYDYSRNSDIRLSIVKEDEETIR